MAFPEDEDDAAPAVLPLLFWGQVTARDDPEKRGRVRALVPGLLEPESPWLQPVGMPGAGFAQRGAYVVPVIGATILVGFIQGDVEEGVYWPGPPGAPGGTTDIPETPAAASPADAPAHVAYETERFEIVVIDRADEHRLVIRNKRNGDYIEFDDRDNTITVKGTTSLNLFADGQIDIRGGVVSIQGQQVPKLGRRTL